MSATLSATTTDMNDPPLPLDHELHVLFGPHQLQSRTHTLVRSRDELGQGSDGNVERAKDTRCRFETIRLAALSVGKVLGESLFEGESV